MKYGMTGRASVLIAGLICVLFFSSIVALPQGIKPITKNGLLEALQIGGLTTNELVRLVQQRGVDFELTDEIEAELRRAGAKAELIRVVSAHRRGKNAPVKAPGVVTNTSPPPPPPPRVALGLVVQDLTPALAASLKLRETRGVMVSAVEQGSLADKAGVERKDVITAVNDVPISDTDGMRRQITRLHSGGALALTVLRDNASRQLTIASAINKNEAPPPERPASGRGKLGLRVEPLTAEMAARLNLSNAKGLIVTVVDASGPAAAAGIKINDVIEELNGQAVRTIPDVEAALAKAISNRIRVRIKRGGKPLDVELQPRT